jgi:hypothetical protein
LNSHHQEQNREGVKAQSGQYMTYVGWAITDTFGIEGMIGEKIVTSSFGQAALGVS